MAASIEAAVFYTFYNVDLSSCIRLILSRFHNTILSLDSDRCIERGTLSQSEDSVLSIGMV
jgi:hypothetical protein